MPVSKKRKKKGKPVKRGSDRLSHLTLQDLINVVAYQDTHGTAGAEYSDEGVELPDFPTHIDYEDPTTQSVIRAVSEVSKLKEDYDGR